MSKYLSGYFTGTAGFTQAMLSARFDLLPDESTASIWKYLHSTQPDYPGTVIPQSFTVDTPNGRFWTHGNATEHMYEALISIKSDPMLRNTNPNLFAQFILYDYRQALIRATRVPLRLNTPIRSGHWEFVLRQKAGDRYPAVVHAMFFGLE